MGIFDKVNKTLTESNGNNNGNNNNSGLIAQLKSEIRALEKESEMYYMNIGKAYELEDNNALALWMGKLKANKNSIINKKNQANELEPKKNVCETCGKEFASNVNFCGLCGSSTVQVLAKIICKNCGLSNDPTVKFCLHCGNNLL